MQILTENDPRYPKRLRETYHPPKKLYVRGNADILNEPQIAIVGSRHPTPIGLENAKQFAYLLSKAGLIITSGLAMGIDGAAHQGAIEAQCPTIAILANGLDFIYPKRHETMANTIIKSGGALLSEWPPGTPARAPHFPQRNRIISGMSIGTLVVEATLRSGSLITARLAMEQNRDVFAIPGSIHSPQSEGCHSLINQGAKLVSDANAILEEIPFSPKAITAPIPERQALVLEKLDKPERLLLECVDFSPTTLEEIQQRSGLKRDEVNTILLSLEIKGYINKRMSGYLRLRS